MAGQDCTKRSKHMPRNFSVVATIDKMRKALNIATTALQNIASEGACESGFMEHCSGGCRDNLAGMAEDALDAMKPFDTSSTT